ncbi:hypothetical protein [Desmospora profundinema]|uniref:Uncharacterized protein n=1 Tax=Desmospora profundinema TaxID=1571184 RepID=A0ABU1IN79_9BACL|nr:hypothetical protein [Desmospora profundinema]MDR6225235.1 hypothetical protein [Desmospora profundinema]
MRQWFLIILVIGFAIFWTNEVSAHNRPPAQISQVEGFYVMNGDREAFTVSRMVQTELENVLSQVEQMAGMRSHALPPRYLLFRFPQPVAFIQSPISHPVREVIVIAAPTKWEPARLLIKNPKNQWVEYRTSRSLKPLLHQLKKEVRKKKSGSLSLMPYYTATRFQI